MTTRWIRGAVLVALSCAGAAAMAGDALAANGDLDPSFGVDGKARADFGYFAEGAAVALAPDGKIVMVGRAAPPGTVSFAVARLTPDGILDPTFSGDGMQTVPFGISDSGRDVAVQPDGKIVVAGSAIGGGGQPGGNGIEVVRLDSDGTLDPTFSDDGIATTGFGDYGDFTGASSIAIQPDGRIVVAGGSFNPPDNQTFALARYTPDGELDSSFSGDGKQTTGFAGADARVMAIALLGNGKIVAAGATGPSRGNDFALARYGADGSLDAGFGDDGRQLTDFGGIDEAHALAIQPDGKIVLAGHSQSLADTAFALARYSAGGVLDPSFSADGRQTTDFGGSVGPGLGVQGAIDGAFGVAIQPDGKIVAAGEDEGGGQADLALARYAADGSLDPGFSGDGVQTTDIGGNELGSDLVLADGRPLVVGTTDAGGKIGDFDFLLARYQSDSDHYLRVEATVSGPGHVVGPRILCPPDCVGSYATPQPIALSAVPGAGVQLLGFSGACQGLTCSFVVDSDKSVTATFGTPTAACPGASFGQPCKVDSTNECSKAQAHTKKAKRALRKLKRADAAEKRIAKATKRLRRAKKRERLACGKLG